MHTRFLHILLVLFLLTSSIISLAKDTVQESSKPIKNIILIIGDGMGFPAVGLLRHYAHHAPNSIYNNSHGITALEQAMNDGSLSICYTEPYDAPVIDSAAAASQLATGYHTRSGMIGGDHIGNSKETVLELAKRLGRATGLVSDTRITHATPASFASHIFNRYEESAIAEQLVDKINGPDVMLSGGLRYFIPESASNKSSAAYISLTKTRSIPYWFKSKRRDEKNLIEYAEKIAGYETAFSREDLNSLHGPKVLGLFEYSGMHDGITETWFRDDPRRRWPTLTK
ncbi:alkaline phosphatase [bacterium]|nr:alkaline phosphatase [bacterium]